MTEFMHKESPVWNLRMVVIRGNPHALQIPVASADELTNRANERPRCVGREINTSRLRGQQGFLLDQCPCRCLGSQWQRIDAKQIRTCRKLPVGLLGPVGVVGG